MVLGYDVRSFFAHLLLAAAAAYPACGHAQEPLTLKFSYASGPETPKGKAIQRFKELVESRTHGLVKVESYPYSALYKDREEVEALQLGAVEMLAPAVSKFGTLGIKDFEAFDLPYLFDGERALRKVLDGPVGAELLKKLETKGLIGLAYWTSGFRSLSADRPLKVPSDARGLKFRIPSSKILDAEIRAIGGIPQVLAPAEVYQGLQTGVVDATESTPSNFYDQKLFEVQGHYVLTRHSALVYVVIVNKEFWQRLPPDVRPILEAALKEATEYGNGLAAKGNDDALNAVRKSGRTLVYEPSEAERTAWKRALSAVHAQAASRVGSELVQRIYRETGFDPANLQ